MKTMAIRLDDELHAQLSVLAQLLGISVTDFIRQAIENQLAASRSQPELSAKAQDVLADIEAEATARRQAIASLFAPSEGESGEAKPKGGRRRSSGS